MRPSGVRRNSGHPWSWSVTAKQFAVFSFVGIVAFLIDTGILYAALPLFAGNFPIARALSWFCAVSCTWALNYQLTFRYQARYLPLSWLKYVMANLLGGSINYAVSLATVGLSTAARDRPVLAVAAGSLAGLVFNFVASKAFVFRGQ
jgi:putative flippase GtrA